MKRFLSTLLLGLLFVSPLHADDAKLKVVASFSILGDIVKQIGGDAVDVTTLVGPDGDAHVFQPTAGDARAIADANLVVFNGLGFEGWMDRLQKQSGTKASTVIASDGIDKRKFEDKDDHDDHKDHDTHDHEAHDHGAFDPHAWQSVPNVLVYVANIRNALIKADPAHEKAYRANAEKYLMELRTLDAWIRAQLKAIPAEKRKIVTNHDAFGYFAAEYGVTLLAAQGMQTETEPSAAQIAKLITRMKEQNVKAAFIENISNPSLIRTLQEQGGVKFGGRLYSDALGEKAPADTYLGMMRWNVTSITEALK
jgi:zinc/manganese transport system substrate-binding protein